MVDALAVAYVDIEPNMDRFGPALTDGLGPSSPVGRSAQTAGESLATSIGTGMRNLGGQIGGEVGNIVSRVGAGLDALGRSGSQLGVKLMAVGGVAVGLGTALQSMGSADSAAQQQLQAAITATGQSWGDYQTKIEQAIKAGENFGQNAAQTQNALQALTTATNDPAKALQFLGVAFDLAAARHIDLVSAATLVARALEGNTRLLKQYGIDTTGVATSSTDAAAAVTVLGTKLSGQASASVNTFNGRLEVAKAKLGDLAAQFAGPVGAGLQGFGAGTAIVGGIIQSKLIQNMKSAVFEAEGFSGKLAALSGSGLGSVGKFAVGLTVLAVGLDAVGTAFTHIDKGVGPNALLNTLTQLPAGGSNLNQLTSDTTGFVNTVGRLTDPGVVDKVNNFSEAFNGLFNIHGGGQETAKTTITQIDQGLTQLVQSGHAKTAATDLQRMDDVLRANGKNVGAYNALLTGYNDAIAGTATGTTAAAAATKTYAQKLVALTVAQEAAAAGILGTTKSLWDNRAAMVDAEATVRGLGKATKLSADQMATGMDAAQIAIQGAADATHNASGKVPAMLHMIDLLEKGMNTRSPMYKALQAERALLDATFKDRTALLNLKMMVNGKPVAGYAAAAYLAKTHGGGSGPGHPTALGGRVPMLAGNAYSDSMLQPVSGGEYVVNAAATARPGALAALDAINRGGGQGGGETHLHYHEASGRTGQLTKDDVWKAFVQADALLSLMA